MRVVFMGTPQFAVPSLQALNRTHGVVCAYTRPDAVSGRGRHTRPSPVAEMAASLGIEVRQPATLRDETVQAELATLAPDLLVVAAYGLILPQAVLDAARLGAVNVHASLLPRWRGAAPIQRAILSGDADVGVSIMCMEAGLDTGPYCLQRQLAADDLDAVALTGTLADLGASALLDALPAIEDRTAAWTAQDESLVFGYKTDPSLPTYKSLIRLVTDGDLDAYSTDPMSSLVLPNGSGMPFPPGLSQDQLVWQAHWFKTLGFKRVRFLGYTERLRPILLCTRS